MAYIDFNYYTNTYKGEPVEEADFPSLSERASEIIDSLTCFKIGDISNITDDFILTQIKKATAAEVEFISLNGGYINESGNMSLGKFSYSGTSSNNNLNISTLIFSYLAPTGLLYRGL